MIHIYLSIHIKGQKYISFSCFTRRWYSLILLLQRPKGYIMGMNLPSFCSSSGTLKPRYHGLSII